MNIFSLPLDEFKKEVDKFLEGISPEELLNELEKYGLKIKEGKDMREIKFRGKSVKTNEWVYGYYWTNEIGNHFIRQTVDLNGCFTISDTEVDENTIGQYTGLKDKNGVEIYEADIVNVYYIGGNGIENNKVIYERGSFCAEYSEDYHPLLNEINHCCKVIGNIYDNPELLKESD